MAGADYGANSVPAADVAVTVSDDEAAPDVPGRVTGLTADATAARVALSWTAPAGTVVGYRVEASYDGGSSWAEVMADTGGAGTAYTHGSGLMAGEIRHYRVSAIFGGGGGTGPASDAAEAERDDHARRVDGHGSGRRGRAARRADGRPLLEAHRCRGERSGKLRDPEEKAPPLHAGHVER